jgi:TatD DNase family protein
VKLFDTHAHLADPQLAAAETEVLEAAARDGLVGIVAIGIDLVTSYRCLEIARRHSWVFSSAGIHPNHAHQFSDSDWQQIEALARRDEVVAIGETGLDLYWDDCPIDIQRHAFARHVELSFATGKPLVVHMRECESEILQFFDQHQQLGKIMGIMHSFSGSWETAQRCLDYGMFISFSGVVTFKNAVNLRDVANKVPIDKLLVETDAPYLTPHPHRSVRPNEPRMVRFTAQVLAQERGMAVEELAEITTANARRVFQLKS